MDIRKVLQELHAELSRIDEAIRTLERLESGARRRGRPPGWLALVNGISVESAKKTKKKAAK